MSLSTLGKNQFIVQKYTHTYPTAAEGERMLGEERPTDGVPNGNIQERNKV
jgi:hypothetical protein